MEAFIQDLGILINATLIATPPLLLAALGSCFSERSGVINIGIEGMMTIGAFTGAVVAHFTGNGWIGFYVEVWQEQFLHFCMHLYVYSFRQIRL